MAQIIASFMAGLILGIALVVQTENITVVEDNGNQLQITLKKQRYLLQKCSEVKCS